MKNQHKTKDLFQMGFQLGLVFKGLNALAQITGSIILFFLPPDKIEHLIGFITHREFFEEPMGMLAGVIYKVINGFTPDLQNYAMIYMFFNGVAKITFLFLLWKQKLWVYPLSVVYLMSMSAYQIYRFYMEPSLAYVVLMVMNIAMIVMIIIEYERIKKEASIK